MFRRLRMVSLVLSRVLSRVRSRSLSLSLSLVLLLACAGGSAGRVDEVAVPAAAAPAPERRPVPDGVASARRGLEPRLDTNPIPAIPRTHPAVGKLRGKGSLSLGTTRDGLLVGCRTLPLETATLRVLATQAQRGLNCGTDELVEALQRASREVAKAVPGSVLTVGNIGRGGGGDIPWSISHNSGRDVDLGFYLLDGEGRQVIPGNLVRVDAAGRGLADGVPVRLDVRRTWLMIRALLTDPSIEIQWLFVSSPVRKALLEHAKKRREPAGLVRKAEEALAQPARARPHDDHVHLRIYCPADDLLEGCQDRGTNRPWYVDRTARIADRVAELTGLLGSRKAEERAGAATVLGRMGRTELAGRVAALLGDREPVVRLAAARALEDLGPEGNLAAIERRIDDLPEEAAVLALLRAIERIHGADARAAALGRLLGSRREFAVDMGVFQTWWTVGRWATDALVRLGGPAAVEVLVARAGDAADPKAVHEALRSLTGTDPAGEAGADPAGAWRAWWARNRKLEPSRWYEAALHADGTLAGRVPAVSDLPALVALLRKGDWHGRAALALVRAIAGRSAARLPPDGVEPVATLVERVLALPATDGGDGAAADTDP